MSLCKAIEGATHFWECVAPGLPIFILRQFVTSACRVSDESEILHDISSHPTLVSSAE